MISAQGRVAKCDLPHDGFVHDRVRAIWWVVHRRFPFLLRQGGDLSQDVELCNLELQLVFRGRVRFAEFLPAVQKWFRSRMSSYGWRVRNVGAGRYRFVSDDFIEIESLGDDVRHPGLLWVDEIDVDTPAEIERLHDAMGNLPNRESEVIRLYYFEGLKFREIAKRLGVSFGVPSNYCSRARKRLFDLLKWDESQQYGFRGGRRAVGASLSYQRQWHECRNRALEYA